MGEATFTPGPWKAERCSNEIEIGAETPAGHLSVAWVHLGAHPTASDVEDGKRDAHLLAAAPDLYEVLDEIVTEWGFPNTPKWHKARAALARARGETP
jgi:hypothetical protein